MILASLADTTRLILHAFGAKKGDPLPPSLVESLRHKAEVKDEQKFMTGNDFDRARDAILKRINNG